ncbi:hypothetical protein [Enterovirga sp.]|uniref:hypothetical protein n=1 Tax=Enterovirga sp. TaxID=2026350 RepID=UPI002D0F6997|nr:hypothetical protein [Enterovirga sp.]HMO30312.1 hypothetical protein [Enterovirga sp.]
MPLLLRHLILLACTASAFTVNGRAPGAVSLRLRDLEAEIAGEGRSGPTHKRVIRPVRPKSA